ncbi:MAG: SagB/ThcOx family dehydrogenase [Planctomycetes bacterium]|nr:SagB/ThcOx family dehydrogenase [Planctomycetota bacterium]
MVTNGRHKPLPAPALTGPVSLEEAIRRRRTAREFAEAPLAIEQVGQLCWAGQGITDRQGALRAAPSAGALYPIELYVVTAEGVSRYRPTDHSLEHHLAGDHRRPLQRAALGQEAIGHAPICIIIAAVVERTARKYHDRAERYCFMEAGHVAQNVLLQATALRLAGVPIGAFEDEQVAEALKLPKGHRVLYLLPLGHPRQ